MSSIILSDLTNKPTTIGSDKQATDETCSITKAALKAVNPLIPTVSHTKLVVTPPKITSSPPRKEASPTPIPVPIVNEIQAVAKEDARDIMKPLETTYGKVCRPGPKRDEPGKIVVWRGCKMSQLAKMVKAQSAGGAPVNPEATPPTEKEAQRQVGEIGRLPEFTVDPAVAERFGTDAYVAIFEIDQRYLTPGSKSESGAVCHDDAPVKLIGWKKGRASEAASSMPARRV